MFTRALVELLGPTCRVYAVDREPPVRASPNVIPVRADFAKPLVLPDSGDATLDGILLATALHFVRDAEVVLAKLVSRVKAGACIE